MKFDDFDREMRVYEQSLDQCIVPDMFIVARLDGRDFTRLTREICRFEAPFDTRFRDLMTQTVEHLMDCGFKCVYGYTESDEISLLFAPDESTFNRKTRKLNSILAGEASAFFSLALGRIAVFDCRVVPLPNPKRVCDYFSWRQEDAHRNALNAHCYWALHKAGHSAREASASLLKKSVADKNELLFGFGINFNDLPNWQKRGVGLAYQPEEKSGCNPLTGEKVRTFRNRLHVEYDLALGDAYREYILGLCGTR